MRRAFVAAAAGAAGVGFVCWDATDKRGGVGVTRATVATATTAIIVADYKLSLWGLEKGSEPFIVRRNEVHERSARRLLSLCERNGGLYTKAGQFIATASGMPPPYQQQLSKLQDSARVMRWEDVRQVLAAELGADAVDRLAVLQSGDDVSGASDLPGDRAAMKTTVASNDVASTVDSMVNGVMTTAASEASAKAKAKGGGIFVEFDREPVAAASLAQVHRAVTASGEEVAVKVQRPGLRRQFDVDLATMAFITSGVLLAFPNFDFSFLVPEFRDRLARELDFKWEGRSCERTGRALADDPRMVTPKVFWPLTTSRVLTMEYVRGVKVDDGPGLRAAGIDPAAAAEALSDTFARMLACHGFVHGDPHPGNMLVRRQPLRGKHRSGTDRSRDLSSDVSPASHRGGGGGGSDGVQIVLLDHGLYTELGEEERRRMCRLWYAVAMRDPERVGAVSEEMGVPKSLRWVLPQLMARQTSHVSPITDQPNGGGANGTPRKNGRVSAQEAAARVDGLVRGGRPPLTMDQVSEFGRALPREMMVVMRANALIRNITRKLAVDIDRHENSGGMEGGGRGFLGLSLGGFVGGDVGRRMERRR